MSTTTKHPVSEHLTPNCVLFIHELATLALTTPSHVADVHMRINPSAGIISVDSFVGGWIADADNQPATSVTIYLRHNSREVNERQLRGAVETLRHVIATAETHRADVATRKAAELRETAERLLAQAAEMEGAK